MKFFTLLCLATLVAFIPAECPGESFTVMQADGSELVLCQNEDGTLGKAEATGNAASFTGDIDTFYILMCGILVFFMQAGFSMLESGCVAEKNVTNILFKNLMDAGIGAIGFWLVGYGFAYGGIEEDGVFIGSGNFALSDMGKEGQRQWTTWFFQWAFAATAATIVSGAVAERTKISAYFAYSIVITAIIYPVVVHWVWDTEGWLSAFSTGKMLSGDPTTSNGMIDFAGSGVVHMVGGFSGLMGAIVAGPRLGRFAPTNDADGRPIVINEHNKLVAALGVCILWMGWYGFNCGSTLMISGSSITAGKVAVTTTLAAASGMVTTMLVVKLVEKEYSLLKSLNGVLAGLVSITAGCAVVDPWCAFVIGIIGALVYLGAGALLLKLKIDDPLEACPIHGFCGAWGVLAVGIFGTHQNALDAAFDVKAPEAFSNGSQFATQLVGVLAIFAWTVATSGLLFFVIDKTLGMHVEEEIEEAGLDTSEHGGAVYSSKIMVTRVSSTSATFAPATEDEDVKVHVSA